jgi:hypothetical protein
MAKKNPYPRVPYAHAVFGNEERKAVNSVLKTPQIVAGAYAAKFESKVAKLFGKNHGLLVNSGSSANLLAFAIAHLPEGSEVITPALTFSTTVAPIVQNRLIPVFVDVEPGMIVPSCAHVACTVAIMLAPFACQNAAICPPTADTTPSTPESTPDTRPSSAPHAACAAAMIVAPFACHTAAI